MNKLERVRFEQEPETDDQLVDRAKSGDEDAINDIFDRYYDAIQRFLQRKTVNEADAEDLTQETFAKVFRGIDKYQAGSFSGWIYRIANNTFINDYRSKRGDRENMILVDSQDYQPNLRSSEPDPADTVIGRRAIVDTLSTLPEHQRDVMIGVIVDGQAPEDYANSHGISPKTVNTRIHRARKTLLEQRNQDQSVNREV